MTLLDRIIESSRKFESWPIERRRTALKDAQSPAIYADRANADFADETEDRSGI